MFVSMKYPVLLLISIILVLVKNGEAVYLNVETMETSQSTIPVPGPDDGARSSGILKSHSGRSYRTPFSKSLILKAPYGYGILAAVRVIDLRPNKVDNLTIRAIRESSSLFYHNTWSFSHDKTDDSWESTVIDSPTGQISVQFQAGAGGVSSYGYNGFQLTYTTYKERYTCDSKFYTCSNSKCIADTLKCDGHNHCGDRSEQFACSIKPLKRNVAAIVGGVVFLVIAVACVIFIIIRRASRSGIEVQTVISHPPPGNPSGYPPSYPQPGTYYPPPAQPGTCYPPPPPGYSAGNVNPVYH